MTRLLLLICTTLITCNNQPGNQRLEKGFFFKHPRATRLQRLGQYPLEEQYQIYRYGHDRIEPPDLELAEPIAQKGQAVVPFLKEKLGSDKDDLAVRDILYLFEQMLWMNTFDVRQDASLMQTLKSRVANIKDDTIKYSSRDMLEFIENAQRAP